MRKKLLITGLLVVFGVLLVLGALPTMIGNRLIADPIISRLRADDFQLEIDSIRLRWFSPLRFAGVRLKQKDGPELLAIDEIRTDRGLLWYLIDPVRVGTVSVYKPSVDIELLSDTSNLQKLIKALEGIETTDTKADTTKRDLDLRVEVIEATGKVQRAGDQKPLVVIPPFNVAMEYHVSSGSPQVRTLKVEPSLLLNHVELTPELMELGLGHAVPLLANSAWFEGQISLRVDAIEVDLQTPIDSAGELELEMHHVRSGPTNPQFIAFLELVARLRQKEPLRELVFVDGSVVHVALKEQKVVHEGLKFGLPRADERFQMETRGSVGLVDNALDLTINLPVPIEQFARRESVQSLGVPTLDLPVSGTLHEPKIDWSVLRFGAANILADIQTQLGDDAPVVGALIGGLQSITAGDTDDVIANAATIAREALERRRQAKEASSQEVPASESLPTEQSETASRPWRDRIRDAIQRRLSSEPQEE